MTSPVVNLMQGPLCGTLATMFLYGIFCMQTFYYARNYVEDRLLLKVLETVHLAFSIHMIEYYLITNFDNPPALEYLVWQVLLRTSFVFLSTCGGRQEYGGEALDC
ncbi:hypothetical protein PAXINDRAFT_76296 [Paxillus involutus ATCC 200175]|uniref:Unplaced genomic scaffold PAXINscaffold_13, whole genome shotgun sequence n=1 Tax=Paxillus involutus ATCC 200175 TaxID=664439 RepID=A0A0C9U9Z0_PAXIN|nr:hypothetical protein PAXINDRAFT_76296 [Paxillus involutus ATCC 200175]